MFYIRPFTVLRLHHHPDSSRILPASWHPSPCTCRQHSPWLCPRWPCSRRPPYLPYPWSRCQAARQLWKSSGREDEAATSTAYPIGWPSWEWHPPGRRGPQLSHRIRDDVSSRNEMEMGWRRLKQIHVFSSFSTVDRNGKRSILVGWAKWGVGTGSEIKLPDLSPNRVSDPMFSKDPGRPGPDPDRFFCRFDPDPTRNEKAGPTPLWSQ